MGGRPEPNAPAPWVTLDLGTEVPVDRLFLVPAQNTAGQSPCLFPRRFLLEVARSPDFSDAVTLMDQSTCPYPDPHGLPVAVFGRSQMSRYVRLTVLEGRDFGVQDAFALSELLVFSGTQPVSLGAAVTCSWQNRLTEGWGPTYLTDSRMPLGAWEGGTWSPNPGFHFPDSAATDEPVEIVVDLGQDYPLDRIHLLPMENALIPGVGIMPGDFEVALAPQNDDRAMLIHREETQERYVSEVATRVIHTGGQPARFVRLSCSVPSRAPLYVTPGLAEIEVFSDGENVAHGATVRAWRGRSHLDDGTASLTDGFTSRRRSLPIHVWLMQVAERARVERELDDLIPLRQRMAAESELNATWLAAMTLGLGFLIPVAIVERRRLMSREQVDVLRKRIASDLHDDIGSNLGSISMIARVVRRDLEEKTGAKQSIEDLIDLESIARESSQAMRDIVWLIERQHDTIGDLVKRLRETASRLLREHRYEIECDCRSDASRLCLDSKRHLFLFCKEVMHNVAKHAEARNFKLRLIDDGAWLRVVAEDDGVGLQSSDSGHQATVQKLRERAKVLAGDFEIDSTDGRGTTVVLRIPRSVLQSRIPI